MLCEKETERWIFDTVLVVRISWCRHLLVTLFWSCHVFSSLYFMTLGWAKIYIRIHFPVPFAWYRLCICVLFWPSKWLQSWYNIVRALGNPLTPSWESISEPHNLSLCATVFRFHTVRSTFHLHKWATSFSIIHSVLAYAQIYCVNVPHFDESEMKCLEKANLIRSLIRIQFRFLLLYRVCPNVKIAVW